MRRNLKASVAIIVLFLSIATTQAVTIDWVPVGNAGNDPDTRYSLVGSGAVDYSYRRKHRRAIQARHGVLQI